MGREYSTKVNRGEFRKQVLVYFTENLDNRGFSVGTSNES